MATEADLIQKFKDLDIPVGADFEELIHAAFAGANLADLVNNYDSRITTVENDLSTAKDSIQSNTNQLATKADDSKVLHSTVTELNSTDMNTVLTAGFYRSFNGTNGIPSGDNFTIYQVIILSDDRGNGVQLAYGTNSVILGMRSWSSYGTNFTSWVQFADDSKVVHNSGNEEIGGQKTFDTAPIDKTTGNPYSTKSDIATAINAATANMADDSKVVHRDPSTGVVSDSTTFSDLKVGNGQQVASIDVASSEQEATDKASKFTAPGIVIY